MTISATLRPEAELLPWPHLGCGAAHGQRAVRQATFRRLVDVAMARQGRGSQASQDLLQAQHGLVPALGLGEEQVEEEGGDKPQQENAGGAERKEEGGEEEEERSSRLTSAFFMVLSRLLMTSLREPTRSRPSCSNREPRHATAALNPTHTHTSELNFPIFAGNLKAAGLTAAWAGWRESRPCCG